MSELNNRLVSIILPVYNGEKYISLSIESCLQQTHKNIELIVVNDCSTDSTLSIVNQYAEFDDRIKILNNTENKKLPASLNIGHREAKGDFITWTSDDNLYKLNAIEELLNALLKNNADVVYSNFCLIDNFGNIRKEVRLLEFENIIFGNVIGCCFLYKKEVFEKNKGYNESFFLVEDYDFWLRAILHSKYYKLDEFLYSYRTHEDSLSNQIAVFDDKKLLWQENISKMYYEFSKNFSEDHFEIFSELQTKILKYEKIPFDWIIKNHLYIIKFQENLYSNNFFLNKRAIGRAFLDKIIMLMVLDFNPRKIKMHCFFILRNYFYLLNKNDLKILIKYSFFK